MLRLKAERYAYFRNFGFQAIDLLTFCTVEMNMFILMVMRGTGRRTNSVISCALQVQYTVKDSAILKRAQYPVQGYPVHFPFQALFQVWL